MFEFLEKAAGLTSGTATVDVYFANLHQQGKIGAPTFDEAKRDYRAVEERQHVYLDACL